MFLPLRADAEMVVNRENKPLPVKDFAAPHLLCSEGTKPLPPGARRWVWAQVLSRHPGRSSRGEEGGRLCLRGAEDPWAPRLPVAGGSRQSRRGCQRAKDAVLSCVPPHLGAGGGGHRTEIGVGLCQPHPWGNILEPGVALTNQPGGGTTGEGAGRRSWQWLSLQIEPLPWRPALCRALGTELPPSCLEKAASPHSACCQAWAVDKLHLSRCPGPSLTAQRQDNSSSRTNLRPAGPGQLAELEQALLPQLPSGSGRCCQLRLGFTCSASHLTASRSPVHLPGSPSSGGSSPTSATEARTCWAATSWPGATSRRPASSWWT